ncbi:hypothetical protein [Streptomyces sp. H39-S7]|uniref:hypothetical protein n=1 Tax=Streptomyces sp. H39-S7 TaxID=3004357 RepID=UPI0022B0337B|nr:hypothetical protein [Streptomyces sp. H39-S7]MCZ4120195.1 hypothetical protein [Streptomyces sp. H39-S7]
MAKEEQLLALVRSGKDSWELRERLVRIQALQQALLGYPEAMNATAPVTATAAPGACVPPDSIASVGGPVRRPQHGHTLAAGGSDDTVRLWNLTTR